MPRLRDQYETVVKPALIEAFQYRNPMQAPRLEKIVVNMGVGEAAQDSKKMTGAVDDLTASAGQQTIGMLKALSSAWPSASVRAVVTMATSSPRMASTLS